VNAETRNVVKPPAPGTPAERPGSPGRAASSRNPGLLPAGVPDSWTFGRDLPCPQCGYNLRSLHDPLCPECGHQFRWQAVLGIICPRCAEPLRDETGPVCAHCFETLNWVQLLGRADPRQQLDFEHSVHSVRPFLYTLVATGSPWHFWNSRRLDAPPNRARLSRYSRFSLGVGLTGLLLLLATAILKWTYIALNDWVALAAGVLVPPTVCLTLIRWYGWTRAGSGTRWGSAARAVAMASSILAWQGAILLFATFAAVCVNFLYPLFENGRFGRPMNGLGLESEAYFDWLLTGRINFRWNPIEAWFNIGVGLSLTFVAVVWWWPFLYLALRRSMGLRRRQAIPLMALGLTASYLCIIAIWMNVIPLSPFADWLLGKLR
jgi:hypothetical protein